MKKRAFLKLSTIAVTGLAFSPFYACNPTTKDGENIIPDLKATVFKLPDLSFELEALEPNIDKETMAIHHGKHHAGYVRKLNAAIEGNSFAQMPLLEMLSTVTASDKGVRNNGGGHFNHSLFWNILAPNAGGAPTGKLSDAINATFGSFDDFKEKLSTAAKTRFGSGWAWLSVDGKGQLFVSSTPNQDNPLMTNLVEQNGTPILGIDVWEHAYYLNYQNKRGDYIQNFFNVINWKAVADNYEKAVG